MKILDLVRHSLGFDPDSDALLKDEQDKVESSPNDNPSEIRKALRDVYVALDALRDSLAKNPQPTLAPEEPLSDNERQKLLREIERLKSSNASVDALRDKLEKTRLSAERQKRSLLERVNDLQSQLSILHEQTEKEALARSLKRKEEQPKSDNDEINSLRAEVEKLTILNSQLSTKSRIADQMISDLQKRASKARREAEAANGADVDDALRKKNERISELQSLADKRKALIERLEAELAQLKGTETPKDDAPQRQRRQKNRRRANNRADNDNPQAPSLF